MFHDFYLDGKSAAENHIKLQAPMEIGAAVPIYEEIQIPGRNGILSFDTGAYKNRRARAKCFAIDVENVIKKINLVNRFLFSKKGYQRLEISGDDSHFMMAKVSNGAEISHRLLRLAPFTVNFDCKPQRFLKDGENTISFDSNGVISNIYGFPSKPIIQIFGTGSGSVTIGDKTIQILSIENEIAIDCETMNAYRGMQNKNTDIKAYEFPTLEAGENTVSFTGGITSVEIKPRWWEL